MTDAPTITAQPLTATAFARFGDVLDTTGPADKLINAGFCERFHDRARLDFGTGSNPETSDPKTNGRAGISLFQAQPRALPYLCDLVERHPDGSQCFVPMHQNPWLVIVAEGHAPTPGPLHAFMVAPGQAVNLLRGTWHGVLTPLHAPGLFAVIDRIGTTPNLEEFQLATPVTITT